MKNILIKTLLGFVLNSILSGSWITELKNVIQQMNSQVLSGSDKKALVVKTIKDMGWNMASWVLNFAIEAVLIIVKIEAGNFSITAVKSTVSER